MVPVSNIISFFQVGAVNNGRNWARIGIMRSEWGMNLLLGKMSFCQLLSYLKRSFMPCFPIQIVQIAMSLRDTTTDENELAMGYTVPQERLRRGRSSTWCYEPATNLIGDVFRHPPSVAPTRGST